MLRKTNYSAIIGPQCSQVCSFVGRLAAYYNIACFSGVCQDTEMLDKTVFTVRESVQSAPSQLVSSLTYASMPFHVHVYISVFLERGIRFDNNVMAAIFFWFNILFRQDFTYPFIKENKKFHRTNVFNQHEATSEHIKRGNIICIKLHVSQ